MTVDEVVYKIVPKNEKTSESSLPHKAPKGLGIRHLQTFLLFICLTIGYGMRSQLSVLMVAMVETNPTDNSNYTDIKNTTHFPNNGNFDKIKNVTNWNVYRGGWIAASASRLVQGMTQAAFYPSIHTMLAKWAPVSERGRLSTYIYTGSQLGTIIAFQISGLFAGSPTLGWPFSFWLFGILSLVTCCLMGWLGAASPHEHSSITSEEMAFILEDANTDALPKKRKTPWRDILKCKAVWGLMTTQAGSAAGYLLVLTEIPPYMSSILGLDIKRNGLYSSLPYIATYVMSLLFGVLVDYARNKKIMKVVNIRRTANSIGMALSGIFLVIFSFMTNTLLALIILIISLGLHSGVQVGFLINQIDLAPNFAGPIMALGNMIANLTSLLVPVVVSSIVTDVNNHHQWQIVFIIFAALLFITNAIFVVFAKGEVQPWNFYGEEGDELERKLDLTEDKKLVKILKNEKTQAL